MLNTTTDASQISSQPANQPANRVFNTPASSPQDLFDKVARYYDQKPDWVTFFREVFGLDGLVRQSFPSEESLQQFERTPEYQEIQQMMARLREQRDTADGAEPTRVITVRLPKSMHEFLRAEAHEKKTSMNKLCISKLLQVVDNELIPIDGIGSSRKTAGERS